MQKLFDGAFLAMGALLVAVCLQECSAAPFAPNPQPFAPQQAPLANSYDFTRFYFNQQKRSADFAPVAVSPWALPRQLAPKFKRFGAFRTNDKRLDDEAISPFYMDNQLRAGRLEWNFNRL